MQHKYVKKQDLVPPIPLLSNSHGNRIIAGRLLEFGGLKYLSSPSMMKWKEHLSGVNFEQY